MSVQRYTLTDSPTEPVLQYTLHDKRASLLPPGPVPRRMNAIRRRTWNAQSRPLLLVTELPSDAIELDSTNVLRTVSAEDLRRHSTPFDIDPPSPDREGFKEVVIDLPSEPRRLSPSNVSKHPSPIPSPSLSPGPVHGRQKSASAPSPLRYNAVHPYREPQVPDIVHPEYERGTPAVALELRKRLEEILQEWESSGAVCPEDEAKRKMTSDSWMVY